MNAKYTFLWLNGLDRVYACRLCSVIFKPSMSALYRKGQQACLAQTFGRLSVDVCCLSETRLFDPPRSYSSPLLMYVWQYSSGNSMARWCWKLVERASSEWIALSSRLCAIRPSECKSTNVHAIKTSVCWSYPSTYRAVYFNSFC